MFTVYSASEACNTLGSEIPPLLHLQIKLWFSVGNLPEACSACGRVTHFHTVSSRSCMPGGRRGDAPHFPPSYDTLHKICHQIQILPQGELSGLEAPEREGERAGAWWNNIVSQPTVSSCPAGSHSTLRRAAGTDRARTSALLSWIPRTDFTSGYSGHFLPFSQVRGKNF